MNCKNCGNQVGDGMKFCPECGADMLEQSAEALTDEAGDKGNPGKNNFSAIPNLANKENAEKAIHQVKEMRGKYNIGHIGVLAGSILSLIASFMPNSGIAEQSVISLLSSQSHRGWANGGYGLRFDGRTYAVILFVLLAVTLLLGYYRKNFLMVIFSVICMVWITYMFINSSGTLLSGLGLLLFPAGGILLVVSSIAAFQISRSQKA